MRKMSLTLPKKIILLIWIDLQNISQALDCPNFLLSISSVGGKIELQALIQKRIYLFVWIWFKISCTFYKLQYTYAFSSMIWCALLNWLVAFLVVVFTSNQGRYLGPILSVIWD